MFWKWRGALRVGYTFLCAFAGRPRWIADSQEVRAVIEVIIGHIVGRRRLWDRERLALFGSPLIGREVMTSTIRARRCCDYESGPAGWSAGRNDSAAGKDEQWCFVGLRRDVLVSRNSRLHVVSARHELQHEIQRVTRGWTDRSFGQRLRAETDAVEAGWLYWLEVGSPGRMDRLLWLVPRPWAIALGAMLAAPAYVRIPGLVGFGLVPAMALASWVPSDRLALVSMACLLFFGLVFFGKIARYTGD